MPTSESGLSRRAIGWALLSQAIWLPLLLIAMHDRWQHAQRSPGLATQAGETRGPGLGPGAAPPLSLGDVIRAAPSAAARLSPPPAAAAAAAAAQAKASPAPGWVLRSPAAAPTPQPPAVSAPTPGAAAAAAPGRSAPAAQAGVAAPPAAVRPMASPSQLLGGSLGLQDLPAALLQPQAASRSGAVAVQPGGGVPSRAAGASARPSPTVVRSDSGAAQPASPGRR